MNTFVCVEYQSRHGSRGFCSRRDVAGVPHAPATRVPDDTRTSFSRSRQGIALKHVEEKINMAMQRRLAGADANLRSVLDLVRPRQLLAIAQ